MNLTEIKEKYAEEKGHMYIDWYMNNNPDEIIKDLMRLAAEAMRSEILSILSASSGYDGFLEMDFENIEIKL